MLDRTRIIRPVLVVGAEPRIALTVARSLWRHAIPVDVGFIGDSTGRLGSRAFRQIVKLPGRLDRAEDFQHALEKLIDKNQYDMLVPTSDTALSLVADCFPALSQRLHVCCPPAAVLRRVLDKDSTLDIARRCGIDVPYSPSIPDLAALDGLRDQLSFPLVAKDKSKSLLEKSPFKVRYFTSFEELTAVFRADPKYGQRTLFQEYCPGMGVGIGALIHRGQMLTAFQHRRLKELPSTGGVAVVAVSEALDPKLLRQAQELLKALEWEGVALVEFRQDPATGRTVLMEVNGRYWGSCSFPVRCGIDLPYYEWQLAHGRTPNIPPAFAVGQVWRWSSGCLLRLHGLMTNSTANPFPHRSRWRELVEFLWDFRPWTTSALGAFWDPLPAAVELGRTVKTLTANSAKGLFWHLLPCRMRTSLRFMQTSEIIAHFKATTLRKLGLRPGRPAPNLLASARSMLFICHGNIIRSALAEVLLKREMKGRRELEVLSAGLQAKTGRCADERARQVARELGVCLDEHHATLLTEELAARADVIFVMDWVNEAKLLARLPEVKHKVFLLGSLDGPGRQPASAWEIADPYEGNLDDVRHCGARIGGIVRELAMTGA